MAQKPEVDVPLLSVRRVANDPDEAIDEGVLERLLLSFDQANDLVLLQELCAVVVKVLAQINTIRSSHELRLPQLYFYELTDYLMRIDTLIRAAKTAARRLGVEPAQPRVNRDFIERVLQSERIRDELKARTKRLPEKVCE
ncbi:hypothetical protein [Kingella oralis]|nr:hypothetical protein [Kingella oralis]